MTVSPAIAKPVINIKNLHVNNSFTGSFTSNNSVSTASTVSRKISTQYDTSFSTGLILSNPTILSENKTKIAMTVVNQSNEFFASTMIVSDKINQFISYLTSPSKEAFVEQNKPTSKTKVIRKKCSSSTPSFS